MPVSRIDKFFPVTLKSVNEQTFKDFELIVVCDVRLAEEIRCLLNTFSFKSRVIGTNLSGVSFAANLGISLATGEYIARWDSDDICDANRFDIQVKELSITEKLHVVGTAVDLIDENGLIITNQKFKFYESNEQIRSALRYRCPLLHSSLMFKREVIFKNKGYLYGHTSEDHELFIRIARDPNIIFKNLSNSKTYYRRHLGQLSDIRSNKQFAFYEISAFLLAEFLRTKHIMYLVGVIAVIPVFRQARADIRRFKSTIRKILLA